MVVVNWPIFLGFQGHVILELYKKVPESSHETFLHRTRVKLQTIAQQPLRLVLCQSSAETNAWTS